MRDKPSNLNQVIFLPFLLHAKHLQKVLFSGNELGRRHAASVQARNTQDPASHHSALQRLQNSLGLGHITLDILHGRHGAVQRGLQEQEQRFVGCTCGRFDRRCGIFRGYYPEFSHDLRRPWRRGRLGSESDQTKLY